MILKLSQLKRSIPESFKHEYTIFPVPNPYTNLYPPPPHPIRFILLSRMRWMSGPYKTRMQHLHVTIP